MRKVLLATTVAVLSASAVPALAQSGDDWTGFYVGATAGASWGDTSTSTSATPGGSAIVIPPEVIAGINAAGADSSNDTGFAGGVEAGYNFRSGDWLFGIETDYSAFNVDQSKARTVNSPLLINPPFTTTVTQQISSDWMWTLRGRIGYVSGPWLMYGTAGIASSKIDYRVTFTDNRSPVNTATQSFGDTTSGWTAGLGGAYAFTPNWSVKGEWLYSDFGDIRGTLATANGYVSVKSEAEITGNVFRMGVDYRF